VPAVALSRVGARVVESGPHGVELAADTWQKLETLPDPRSPQGRIYPLACLVAVALCALSAAGHDRLSAVGQWVKRASQADLARLGCPYDVLAGRYRAPDEKTIRVVLDRLEAKALSRALLGKGRPTPKRPRAGDWPSASARDYPARREKAHAKTMARARLAAVAVDGKTARGARRADGSRVHLLGVADHDGRFLDQIAIDAKHNETSHFQELLAGIDLAAVVVTFDALHTVRANLNWLATAKNAHYIAIVKKNQPLLYARLTTLPWRDVPTGTTSRDTGHGRAETRTLKTAYVPDLDLPHARQAVKITRWRQDRRTGKISRETVYAVTSLTTADASPDDLARLVREHWTIEVRHEVALL
jgi:predicted transposase YbfD/YdcC